VVSLHTKSDAKNVLHNDNALLVQGKTLEICTGLYTGESQKKLYLSMVEAIQKRLVIFDLDGTLIDVSKVRHHVEGKKKNFDLFHKTSIDCPPYEKVLNLNKTLQNISDIYIAILTGREEKYRRLSEQWLGIHNISYSTLLMRQNNDFRTNVEVKREIYENLKSQFTPYLAIDDTAQLRDLWRDVGFSLIYDPLNFSHTE
jgi:hypothetical protein